MKSKKRNSEFSDSDNNSHIHINVYCLSAGVVSPVTVTYGKAIGIGCAIAVFAGISIGMTRTRADTIFQEMGLTQLQQNASALTGDGVVVAQVEASVSSSTENAFEPDPSGVGANPNIFTFINSNGVSSSTYSGSYGSWHANNVASIWYGSSGVSTGVSAVYVYAENWYYDTMYLNWSPVTTPSGQSPSVVNQSFMMPAMSSAESQYYDQIWDNYAARYNVLYVTAIGDGQTTTTSPASYINPPADAYNGIAVGVYTGSESNGLYSASTGAQATWVGPTWDGRSKPDLVAPAPAQGPWTSYTAPEVSGVATLMVQAAQGTDLSAPVGLDASNAAILAQGTTAYITAATDIRTVKALLLNGAVKPVGWTNSYSVNNGTYSYNAVNTTAITPLDPRYGSGVVNAYNSYENLAGGEHNYSAVDSAVIASLPTVTSVPPVSFSGSYTQTVSSANPTTMEGWNLATIAAGTTCNSVENYDFSLPGTSANAWDLTATLTWNKDYNASGINHLLLFLLNSSGQQMAASVSLLDNVQQININPALGINPLTPGQYDLAVEMLGGVNAISTSDTYALAWNFTDPTSAPEPGVLPLLALGAGMLLMARPRIASGHA